MIEWKLSFIISIMKKVKLSKFPIYKDDRGCFIATELEDRWIQSNISVNDNPFTFRGLHLQKGPRKQAKQISVIKGKIIDFLVCLTEENFGKVEFYELSEGDSIYVPKNYAHGFLTLTSGTILNYFVDEIYSKPHEISIHWMSVPEVKNVVEEFVGNNRLIISEKDNLAIDLKEYANELGFK